MSVYTVLKIIERRPNWYFLTPFFLLVHQKSFVGGCVVTLYNTASGVLGHHLSFSEINCKDSPQFASKLLYSRQKNQKNIFLGHDNSIPGAIWASSGVAIFSIWFKLCHTVTSVQTPPFIWTGCCWPERFEAFCPVWEPSAQGLVCSPAVHLPLVSLEAH